MKKLLLVILIFVFSCGTAWELRRQDYVSNHLELDSITKNYILNGIIAIGMTKEEVIASWGEPYEVKKIDESSETWVYGRQNKRLEHINTDYLQFHQNKLVDATRYGYSIHPEVVLNKPEQ